MNTHSSPQPNYGHGHGQYNPYTASLPAAEPQKPRRWPWIVGVVVAFLLGVAVGGAGESASSAPAYEPAPTTVESADLPPSLVEQAPPAAPEPAPAPAPAESAGGFGNGTYEIGDEVQPGKYKSPGPESGLFELCYVDVQRGDDFLLQEVSNDGQVRIEIRESWKGALMEVSGCQPFAKVG